ncbi:hypothetical protein J2O02_11965 [Elizabethkingia anophelis]|uniref:hypothetical protein n=1 Tax=Elizabethkingia anophelis TaxID=1117645 RepID=UPI0020B31EFD|nr:hypothetical protein [Elizabethkingia anophelis]UTF99037.1 hypothetical protein J2O04_12255 [Elizabethkingia anophelis]UTG63795.1 hypothetical protein J2O02_11965 [Elizabethkingia anophelis]
MTPQILKNITHIKFIATSIFQLDEIIKEYGKTFNNNETIIERRYLKIIYSTPEFKTNISNIDSDLYTISELGDGFLIQKRDPEIIQITKQEYENSKEKDESVFTTLNYDDFPEKFDYDVEFTTFYWQVLDYKYRPEFIESLKSELVNANTETACKIIYQELFLHIKESEDFLTRFQNNKLWQLGNEYSNDIQKTACSFLLKYNKSLLSDIKDYFITIFPKDLKNIEENINHIIINKEDSEKEKLRNSNIYKIAVLFADGTIHKYGIYENDTYLSISKLTDLIIRDFGGFARNSLQPYLNDTLNQNNSNKNLFHLSKLKYLQLIAEDFSSQNKTISSHFSNKLDQLMSILPQN